MTPKTLCGGRERVVRTCYPPSICAIRGLGKPASFPRGPSQPFSNPSPHSIQAVCQSAHHMYQYSCPSCAPDQHVHVVNHRVYGLHMLACSSCHRHSCLALRNPFVPFPRFDWLPNTQLPVLRHQAASAQIFLVSLCLVGKTPLFMQCH
jgi:hypothetical protein